MRRLERDHLKSKKRADQLQKEKDQGRSELSKTISIKEKLEKLCRELTRENKKIKVGSKLTVNRLSLNISTDELVVPRRNTNGWKTPKKRAAKSLVID